jgi:hypothetical protein
VYDTLESSTICFYEIFNHDIVNFITTPQHLAQKNHLKQKYATRYIMLPPI